LEAQESLAVKRREFITLLSGAAAWPLAVRTQQSAMPVVGFLGAGAREPLRQQIAAFLEGLKESGYVEGQNVAVEYRFAAGQFDRFPALASGHVAAAPPRSSVMNARRLMSDMGASSYPSGSPGRFTAGSACHIRLVLGCLISWTQSGPGRRSVGSGREAGLDEAGKGCRFEIHLENLG
jgi:hypothetical protein